MLPKGDIVFRNHSYLAGSVKSLERDRTGKGENLLIGGRQQTTVDRATHQGMVQQQICQEVTQSSCYCRM